MAKKESQDTPTPSITPNLTKTQATQKHLDAQEKVMYTIPKQPGSPPEYVVNINGCKYTIAAGVPTKVPQQVADMLNARMESEGQLVAQSEAAAANMAKGGL